MALGGLAPVLIFTFLKQVDTPAFLGVPSVKIPLVPIPVYLDEKITGIVLDDYNRTIAIEVQRDDGRTFEKVTGDVVQMKFRAKKGNIVLTALTALFDKVIKSVEDQDYFLTVFYDNIFLLEASLESFQTSLVDGTDLREVSITVSNKPAKIDTGPSGVLARAGTALGL